MTLGEALEAATSMKPGERLARYESRCGPRGGCSRARLLNDSLGWTWCPDCLTVYDTYENAVNQIPEFNGHSEEAKHR